MRPLINCIKVSLDKRNLPESKRNLRGFGELDEFKTS
jgi:hypothetical protein